MFLGKKIKDTQMKASCKIKILRETSEIYQVTLEGDPGGCSLAKSIILLAVRHNHNSLLSKAPSPNNIDNLNIISHDLRTFWSETQHLKAD